MIKLAGDLSIEEYLMTDGDYNPFLRKCNNCKSITYSPVIIGKIICQYCKTST